VIFVPRHPYDETVSYTIVTLSPYLTARSGAGYCNGYSATNVGTAYYIGCRLQVPSEPLPCPNLSDLCGAQAAHCIQGRHVLNSAMQCVSRAVRLPRESGCGRRGLGQVPEAMKVARM
jgi:hypothetical protein